MAGGRPSKYKDTFPQDIIDFFDIEPYEDKEIEHYGKEGELKWVDLKRMANRLPTLRRFAKEIGVGISTVYDWLNPEHASYHKEFSDAFTQAKDLQKWFLIENGLNGCYNPLFAKFTAINITDMRDKQEVTEDVTIKHTFTNLLKEIDGSEESVPEIESETGKS